MVLLPGNTDLIDFHSHFPVEEKGVFRIYNVFPEDFAGLKYTGPLSIGLHPWFIDKYENLRSLDKDLENLAITDQVLMIGETGLDKYRNKDISLQKQVFETHIHLSEKLKKPLVIHCVRAFNELLEIQKHLKPKQAWIIHGFNSGTEIARQLVEKGFYLSIGERFLLSHNDQKEFFTQIPWSRMFFETDDGKMSIMHLYEHFADLSQIETRVLKEFISGNFKTIFSHD